MQTWSCGLIHTPAEGWIFTRCPMVMMMQQFFPCSPTHPAPDVITHSSTLRVCLIKNAFQHEKLWDISMSFSHTRTHTWPRGLARFWETWPPLTWQWEQAEIKMFMSWPLKVLITMRKMDGCSVQMDKWRIIIHFTGGVQVVCFFFPPPRLSGSEQYCGIWKGQHVQCSFKSVPFHWDRFLSQQYKLCQKYCLPLVQPGDMTIK